MGKLREFLKRLLFGAAQEHPDQRQKREHRDSSGAARPEEKPESPAVGGSVTKPVGTSAATVPPAKPGPTSSASKASVPPTSTPAIARPSQVARSVDPRVDSDPELLQYPGRKIATTDVVVGLDFGTSCTKVVIQSPFKLGGRAVAVDLESVCLPGWRYLVPASLHADPAGRASLGPVPPGGKTLNHIKVGVLDRCRDPDNRGFSGSTEAAVVYLAAVLRESRRWFLKSQEESYRTDTLVWSMNLGIPSAGYGDEAVRAEFTRIGRAAWRLSLSSAPLTINAGAVELHNSKTNHGTNVAVIPEVAAQVVSFARSKQREDGLHVLFDLGASTLDACSFLLGRTANEEDDYAFLTADVQRWGLYELHRRRMRATRYTPPFDSVPDEIVGPLPEPSGTEPNEVKEALRACDAEFRENCVQLVCKIVCDLKSRRDPHSSRWRSGLPFFACGGGCRSRFMQDVLALAQERITGAYAVRGIVSRKLPVPAIIGVGERPVMPLDFERLAVAYGLSFPDIDIGAIHSPWETGDIDPQRGPGGEWRVRYSDDD